MTRLLAIGLCLLVLPHAAPASEPGAGPAHPLAPAPPPQVPAGRPSLVSGEVATPRFRILYTAQAEGAALALAQTIELTRDRFCEVLGRDWPGVTEVRLGVGRQELEALAIAPGKVPGWAEALAYPTHNVLLLDAHSLSKPDGSATLRHELSHVALGQLGGAWPRWFQEGLAVYLTGEQRFSMTSYRVLFRAVQQERIFRFADLAERWPDHPSEVELAYIQSAAFVSFLIERHGSIKLRALLDGVRGGEPFETSFAKAFRSSLLLEEGGWRAELPGRYSWVPLVTGGTTLWTLAAGITVLAWLRRRRANAQKRAAQAAEEAAHDAAMRLLEAEQRAEEAEFERLGPREDELEDEPSKDKPTLH